MMMMGLFLMMMIICQINFIGVTLICQFNSIGVTLFMMPMSTFVTGYNNYSHCSHPKQHA